MGFSVDTPQVHSDCLQEQQRVEAIAEMNLNGNLFFEGSVKNGPDSACRACLDALGTSKNELQGMLAFEPQFLQAKVRNNADIGLCHSAEVP